MRFVFASAEEFIYHARSGSESRSSGAHGAAFCLILPVGKALILREPGPGHQIPTLDVACPVAVSRLIIPASEMKSVRGYQCV